MNFPHSETDVAKLFGLSSETLRSLRGEVLTPGLDFDKCGKRLCYSQRGVLNLAAASGIQEKEVLAVLNRLDRADVAFISPPPDSAEPSHPPNDSPPSGPVWATVHRHFINVRQVAICLESSGSIERCRVKHSGHLKAGERIQVRPSPQAGDSFYVLDQRERTL